MSAAKKAAPYAHVARMLKWLRARGFRGAKVHAELSETIVISVIPSNLVTETDRLISLLREKGILGPGFDRSRMMVCAYYDPTLPADVVSYIDLADVDERGVSQL